MGLSQIHTRVEPGQCLAGYSGSADYYTLRCFAPAAIGSIERGFLAKNAACGLKAPLMLRAEPGTVFCILISLRSLLAHKDQTQILIY
jgi:hypothetical protein